jgi:hypothetical protein
MTQTEIIEEIKKLTASERINFIEETLHFIREDLQLHQKLEQHQRSRLKRKQKLQKAAKALLTDYLTDDKLTSFTILDSEAFHE